MVEYTPSIHEDLGPIPSITNINTSNNNNKLQKMHVFGLIVLEVHAGYKRHGTGSGQAQEAILHNDGRKSVCAGVGGVYFLPCPYKAT